MNYSSYGVYHGIYQWQRHRSVRPLPNQRICPVFEISEDFRPL